jgi:hypothetical protein
VPEITFTRTFPPTPSFFKKKYYSQQQPHGPREALSLANLSVGLSTPNAQAQKKTKKTEMDSASLRQSLTKMGVQV